MIICSYPHLRNLVKAYFHQDYEFETDEEGWMEYAATHSFADRKSLGQDARRFLDDHGDAPSAAFARIFQPDLNLGESNDEIRDWLEGAIRTIVTPDPV